LRTDYNCIVFFFVSLQRDQDAHAVARGARTIPEFFPLRVSYLYGGGYPALLDWHDSEIGTASGAFPPLFLPYTSR
jgi:hypothetical protein